MSFDNSQCPCGGKKPPEEMLCDQCVADLSSRPEMETFRDQQRPTDLRRHAAIILITLSRGLGRKRGTYNHQPATT